MRDLLSIYKLDESAVVARYHELEDSLDTIATAEETNEPIISLGEGFGKYQKILGCRKQGGFCDSHFRCICIWEADKWASTIMKNHMRDRQSVL